MSSLLTLNRLKVRDVVGTISCNQLPSLLFLFRWQILSEDNVATLINAYNLNAICSGTHKPLGLRQIEMFDFHFLINSLAPLQANFSSTKQVSLISN